MRSSLKCSTGLSALLVRDTGYIFCISPPSRLCLHGAVSLLHQASAFSCHSLAESRNERANLDQSWQIMRLNQPVGVKADHLGFSSLLQSLQICLTPFISSEVYTTNTAFRG